MKFGLYISTQWPEGADISSEMDNMMEQVRVARDSGFSSVWMGQHYLVAPMQMMQTMPLLARLAAEGEGMTFGTAVILLSMLNPAVVAEEAATLDWITGGNFTLGVGMGYRKEEFETLGVPFNQRVGRLEEGIEVIRRLWTEDRVDHHGKYFNIDGLGTSIKPKRPGGPPIWLGGQVPAAVARAARLGDAWMAAPTDSIGRVAKCIEMFRAARTEAGLPMPESMPITRECCVRGTRAEALDVCRPSLLDKYKAYASWGAAGSSEKARTFADAFDDFMVDRFIVGDEAEVADEFLRYRDELGIDTFILRMSWVGMGQAPMLETIERVGRIAARIG
ncbi:MAG: LLM class flavin-dependent oxidoreductase [Rickettsiales bacterium]